MIENLKILNYLKEKDWDKYYENFYENLKIKI